MIGWTHSKHRPTTGSLLNLCWTLDGTQIAGAGGNGAVVLGEVLGRRREWYVVLYKACLFVVPEASNDPMAVTTIGARIPQS